MHLINIYFKYHRIPASSLNEFKEGWLEKEIRDAEEKCKDMPEWEKEHYRRVLGP